jgi:hypothetical protein
VKVDNYDTFKNISTFKIKNCQHLSLFNKDLKMIYLCNIKYFHSIVLQLLAMSSITFSFLYTLRDFTITCHFSGLHVASRPAVLTLASTTLCLE